MEQVEAADPESGQLAGPQAGVGVEADQERERRRNDRGELLDLGGGKEMHLPADDSRQPYPLGRVPGSRFASTAAARTWETGPVGLDRNGIVPA